MRFGTSQISTPRSRDQQSGGKWVYTFYIGSEGGNPPSEWESLGRTFLRGRNPGAGQGESHCGPRPSSGGFGWARWELRHILVPVIRKCVTEYDIVETMILGGNSGCHPAIIRNIPSHTPTD